NMTGICSSSSIVGGIFPPIFPCVLLPLVLFTIVTLPIPEPTVLNEDIVEVERFRECPDVDKAGELSPDVIVIPLDDDADDPVFIAMLAEAKVEVTGVIGLVIEL